MPQNWKTYNLDEIAEVVDSLHKTPSYQDFGFPMVRVTDVKGGSLQLNDTLKVSESVFKEFSKKYQPKRGDIIMTRVGTYGSASYVHTNEDFCLGQNTIVIVPKSDSRFLYYSIISPFVKEQIEAQVTGSTQKTISLKSIRALEIQTPELPEQKSIASILSALDDKIELNLATNRTLEQMAMALYKHWFVDFGPFQQGNFINSELGPIPEGWEVKRLDYVLEIKYGKDHKKLPDGNIPLYGSGGIMRYVNQHLYDQESILIPRKGTLSNLFYLREPFWSVDTMFYSKVKLPNYGKYVFHFLRTTDLASMDVGSAIPSLTTELLYKIELIIPDQQSINLFDTIVSGWFNQIDANKQENQTLTTLRDTLLPKLISGAVRVKDAERTVAHAL